MRSETNSGAASWTDREELLESNLSVRSGSVDSMDDINVYTGESFSKCEKLKRDETYQIKTAIIKDKKAMQC